MMLIISLWYVIGIVGLSLILLDQKDRLTITNLVCSSIVGLAGGGMFIMIIFFITNKKA